MSDNQLLEVIERYLNGEMSPEESMRFELLRKENADIDSRVTEHQQFADALQHYADRVELERRLNEIHAEIDVHILKENLMVHPSWVVQMWRHHHSKISVAATVALFVMVSVMYVTGSFNKNETNLVELKNTVYNQSRQIKALSNDIKKTVHVDRYNASGTGFAITSDGLIATNSHIVQGADSVKVENVDGESFKAEVLYTENDITILKIIDSDFKGLGPIPYTFKRSESDLAESISTFGFPSGKPVYHNGVINAASGLNGDSIHYQVSVPITFGNSGGPLWDSKGNIIGITDAKQGHAEGDHYAIKAKYLLDAIRNIPADSLDDEKVSINKKNSLAGLSEDRKLKKEKNYVFMIKAYGN